MGINPTDPEQYSEYERKQREEYRKEIEKKTKEYIEAKKREREEEKRKKEQEKAMREEAERKQHERVIESWQVGWSIKHKELYKQMCELVGDLRTAMIDLTSDSERMSKFKVLLDEFLREPIQLGETSLSQVPIYEILFYGWIIQIFKQDGTWKLKIPSDCPHRLQLKIENDFPVAIEVYMRNELIPFTSLKGILKLKK